MNVLTAGLASLAVAVPLVGALPDLAEHPHWWQFQAAVAIALGLFGLALLYRGILSPVPLIDVEEPWNVAYDRLRNATHQFVAEVAEASFSSIREKDPNPLPKWDDYAAYVPLPLAEVGPLHACEHDLTGHEDLRVRLFFELARACEGIRAGSEWRRLGVRTYDAFFRSRETKPGFREWMEQEEVESGAESLVVLLAYMEFARACTVKTGKNPQHMGFWRLAKEWHPNTLALPRPPASPPEASSSVPVSP